MKTLKFFLISSFLLVTSIFVSAQNSGKDIVYLKNGSVIKGTVLEMTPGGSIKIKTTDGSIFVYPMDDVLKTEKESIAPKSSNSLAPETPGHQGYFMIFRVGPRINSLFDNEDIDVNIGFINGYQINEYFSLGAGIETTNYKFRSSQQRMTPVFADVRFYIPKRRINPMFSFQFGYAIGGTSHATGTNQYTYGSDFYPASGKGGMFLALGAGMRICVNKTFSFVWDGGASLQSFDGYTDQNATYQESKTVASPRLNLGFAINIGGSSKVTK